MGSHKDRLLGFRIDSNIADWFDGFMSDRKIKNTSHAARTIFIMGLQTHRLIVGKDTKLGNDIELQTVIDQLTPEQKEKLLQLLIEKIGMKSIKHYRELADLR